MAEIRAVLTLEQDGSALPDNPTVRRFVFNETSGVINQTFAPDSNATSFHAVAQANMSNLGFIFIATDQPINVKLNNDGTTGFPILGGCEMLIAGTQLEQGTPPNNVQINNPSSTVSANVIMFFAGT